MNQEKMFFHVNLRQLNLVDYYINSSKLYFYNFKLEKNSEKNIGIRLQKCSIIFYNILSQWEFLNSTQIYNLNYIF